MHNRVVRRRKLIHWKGDNDEAAPGQRCKLHRRVGKGGPAKEALHQKPFMSSKVRSSASKAMMKRTIAGTQGGGGANRLRGKQMQCWNPYLLGHRAEEMQTGCERSRCSAGTLSNNARKCKFPILKTIVLCVFYTRWGHCRFKGREPPPIPGVPLFSD